MKLAIASDQHFGYSWDTERQEDSFVQGKEAMVKCLKADAVILPGDIFDSRIPKQEIMDRAMRIISLAAFSASDAVFEGTQPPRGEMPTSAGTPVIAIHGTHERRAKGLTNPVQLLEAAGLCIALHGDAVIITKGNEKVAIHGMGGVPEQYALSVLNECEFKPIPDMVNILVLHQSFREYIYEDAAYLSMADLPPGFDLYINGHVHWSDIKEKNGKILFHPGSTVLTQMRKIEAQQAKKVWFYDTETKAITSEDLDSPRQFTYLEFEASGSPFEIISKARELLSQIPSSNPKPLVKLKISGELPPGSYLDVREITKGFDLLINVDSSLESKQFRKRIDQLREAQSKKSVDELGLSILEKNLEQAGYTGPNPAELLPLLVDGKEEETRKLISDN